MDNDKVIGYVLLFMGLGIIFYALLSAIPVFNGSKQPPELFDLEAPQKSVSIAGKDIRVSDLIGEIIPFAHLNRSGNLMFYLLFMWFLMAAGGKISCIGVGVINGPAVIKRKDKDVKGDAGFKARFQGQQEKSFIPASVNEFPKGDPRL